jgi:hypothetical protein
MPVARRAEGPDGGAVNKLSLCARDLALLPYTRGLISKGIRRRARAAYTARPHSL